MVREEWVRAEAGPRFWRLGLGVDGGCWEAKNVGRGKGWGGGIREEGGWRRRAKAKGPDLEMRAVSFLTRKAEEAEASPRTSILTMAARGEPSDGWIRVVQVVKPEAAGLLQNEVEEIV